MFPKTTLGDLIREGRGAETASGKREDKERGQKRRPCLHPFEGRGGSGEEVVLVRSQTLKEKEKVKGDRSSKKTPGDEWAPHRLLPPWKYWNKGKKRGSTSTKTDGTEAGAPILTMAPVGGTKGE